LSSYTNVNNVACFLFASCSSFVLVYTSIPVEILSFPCRSAAYGKMRKILKSQYAAFLFWVNDRIHTHTYTVEKGWRKYTNAANSCWKI